MPTMGSSMPRAWPSESAIPRRGCSPYEVNGTKFVIDGELVDHDAAMAAMSHAFHIHWAELG